MADRDHAGPVPPGAGPVRVRAPGKINLFLRVGGHDRDGYHRIATVFQAVSLYEEIVARPALRFSVAFSGPVNTSKLTVDGTNLAVRAARALADYAGYRGGVHLDIVKRVPIAGGMGGGSADAAGALVACDALWGTELGREELHRLAATLGADVPFALSGGTALGTGRGDQLSPLLTQGSFHWVLVPAGFALSTPRVYLELDYLREGALREADRREAASARSSSGARQSRRMGTPAVGESVATARQGGQLRGDTSSAAALSVPDELFQALRSGDASTLAGVLRNDLQEPALRLAPSLSQLLDEGVRAGALAGIVSGSGPTVAFLASEPDAAERLRRNFTARGHRALAVTSPAPGPHPISLV